MQVALRNVGSLIASNFRQNPLKKIEVKERIGKGDRGKMGFLMHLRSLRKTAREGKRP